jgi:Cu+-exporting ATPase
LQNLEVKGEKIQKGASKMKRSATTTETIIDPVCRMVLDPSKTDLVTSYQGCSYYFCAEGCRKAFEANPKKYLERKPSKPKGWWGRYLERMAKSNKKVFGDSRPQCH